MSRTILVGRAGAPGVGVGRLLVLEAAPPISTATAGSTTAGAGPVASVEHDRLTSALERAATDLEELAARTAARAGDEIGAIFEAQALFARDPGISDPAFALIDAGWTAEAAILRASSDQADQLAAVDDEYFRERAADVRDVGRRVADVASGTSRPDLWHRDGVPAVLLASDLDPSAVATLRPELVAGIALSGGAPTGHATIVARALGIPLVLGLGSALDGVRDRHAAANGGGPDGAVDGSVGRLIIDPSPDEIAEFGRRASAARSVVPDGIPGDVASTSIHGVTVVANVASALEAEAAVRAGAAGIGLVRTELAFLGRSTPPTAGEQRATYARILEVVGDRPVVFRTLDVGGDKPADWRSVDVEPNPALGVRGVRLGLRRTELLDDQFGALLEAAAGRELRIMLPMVSTREEVDAARARLDSVRADLVAQGRSVPAVIRLGVMIEVPSAAVMADVLAGAAEFFSIGTNDLVQYVMAADRTSAELADLASPLQPAVLRLIGAVVDAATAHDRHVAVCGEAAADPTVIPILIGLGVRELSVGPASVAPVRAVLAGLDIAACRELASRAVAAGTLAEVVALTSSIEVTRPDA